MIFFNFVDRQLQNLHIIENGKASKSLFVKASKHIISEIPEIKNFHIQDRNGNKLMKTLLLFIFLRLRTSEHFTKLF